MNLSYGNQRGQQKYTPQNFAKPIRASNQHQSTNSSTSLEDLVKSLANSTHALR